MDGGTPSGRGEWGSKKYQQLFTDTKLLVYSVEMSLGYSHFSQPALYAESWRGLEWFIFSSDPKWHMDFNILAPI